MPSDDGEEQIRELSINSSTSKNKRSKQENSTWTKQDLMKQKLNLKVKIDLS